MITIDKTEGGTYHVKIALTDDVTQALITNDMQEAVWWAQEVMAHQSVVMASWRDEDVLCSTGRVSTYLDMFHAFQANPTYWREYFLVRLRAFPVVVGRSGAYLLALMQRQGTIWRGGKLTGLEWSGNVPPAGTPVSLVDDCSFTGTTLRELEVAARARDWNVVQTLTGWPYCAIGVLKAPSALSAPST